MIEAWRRVLVLAPHTDDGEFGFGGTIARLIDGGVEVRYVGFSIATKSLPPGFPPDTLAREVRERDDRDRPPPRRPDRARHGGPDLPRASSGDPRAADRPREGWPPDAVLQPSIGDIHQDHQVVAAEGLRAFKRTTVLGYEIPWNSLNFNYQAYVALEQHHVERKVAALARYASQQHRNYANPDYIWNLARTRGINIGRELAEVFEVYRVVT